MSSFVVDCNYINNTNHFVLSFCIQEPTKKNKKDPKAPKKPLSAYMLWLQEVRPSLKKKYPGFSVAEIAKKAGEKWKTVTDKSVSLVCNYILHSYIYSSVCSFIHI